jgi:hypothetical protein
MMEKRHIAVLFSEDLAITIGPEWVLGDILTLLRSCSNAVGLRVELFE